MFLFRICVKTIKLLNSETSPSAIALALSLGLFLGLVPLLTLQAILAAMIVLFFRVNLSATLFTFGLFKLASLALGDAMDALGVALLEAPSLQDLWTGIYNSPLYFCGLHHSVTLGATLIALGLLGPVFLASRWIVLAYRERFNEWWMQLGFVTSFRGTKLYQLYLWLDSPVGGP